MDNESSTTIIAMHRYHSFAVFGIEKIKVRQIVVKLKVPRPAHGQGQDDSLSDDYGHFHCSHGLVWWSNIIFKIG